MRRSNAVAVCLSLVTLLAVPTIASACAVSHPLPAAVLARDAEREGRAWADASLVYVAEVTGTGDRYETFELTPRRILKGGPAAPTLNVQANPSRGMCIIYHGLNVSDGAYLGDEFIIYALSEPASAGHLYVVSARMVGDPVTRAALAASASRQ